MQHFLAEEIPKRGAPRKLPEAAERRVVRAYYAGRVKVQAIANRFGISRTAVYDMVHRNPMLAPDQSVREASESARLAS